MTESNGSTPAANGHPGGPEAWLASRSIQPIAVSPRRAGATVWEFAPEGVRPLPAFGSRPVSARWEDPDRVSRARDVVVAALLALALAVTAGFWVRNAVIQQSGKPAPTQTRDPFAVDGSGGKR